MKSFSINNFVHTQQPNRHNETADEVEMDFDNDFHVDFQSKYANVKFGNAGMNGKRVKREITQGVNPDRYQNFGKTDIGYVSKNGFSYAEPLGNRASFDEAITDDTYRHDNKDALKILPGTEEECCQELYTCGDAATFYKSGKYQFLGLNHENKAIYTKNDKHYISAMQGSWQLTGDITLNSITSFLYNNNYGDKCPTFIGADWKNWNNDDQQYFTSGCAVDVKRHIFDCGRPFNPPQISSYNGIRAEYISDISRTETNLGFADNDEWTDEMYEAAPHSYPWQVSVRAGSHFCGGALIRPDWIVTAAHCAYYFKNWGFSVMVGEHDVASSTEENQEQACIEKIYLHPKYDKANPENGNDIAIVKLAWPVKLNAHVVPICIAPKDFEIQKTDYCVVTGWGKTDPMTDTQTRYLHQARVNIHTSVETCAYHSDSIMCAGDNGAGACKGDSGGPLQCYREADDKWYLVGLTSFNMGNNRDVKCAAWGYASMFTRVSYFHDWIIGGMGWHGDEDASFGEWSVWSECSAACGSSGVQSRTRQCEGTGSCIGETFEERECNRGVACTDSCNVEDIPFHDEMVSWGRKTDCYNSENGIINRGTVCNIVCNTGDHSGDFYPAYRGTTEIKKVRCQCDENGCAWVPPMRQALRNPPLQCLAAAKCAHPAIAYEKLQDQNLVWVNDYGAIVDPARTKTISAAEKIYLRCPAEKIGGNVGEYVEPIVSNIDTEFTCKVIITDNKNIMLFLPFPKRELTAAQICPGNWNVAELN